MESVCFHFYEIIEINILIRCKLRHFQFYQCPFLFNFHLTKRKFLSKRNSERKIYFENFEIKKDKPNLFLTCLLKSG
jgi:hypothetical protein